MKRSGQILVETIIGVGVVALVLSAIIPLFLVGIKAGAESWKLDSARFLGSESLEQAKALNEENWNNLYRPLGTADKGAGNPYHLIQNAGRWELAAGAENISLSGLNFSRQITIDNVSRTGQNGAGELETVYNPGRDDPSTQKITARVSWENTAIEMIDYFGRSKNDLWPQTDWSGGAGAPNWQDPPGNRYFSRTTTFVPAGDIDTSTVGVLKLGKIPGAVAHYGNEFIINSTTTINRLNNQGYRLSMRFTAQKSGSVNQLRVYIDAQQRGNQVFYKYGLQGNAAGNPDGSYISPPATANFSSTGWQTVNLGTPVTVTAGSVYHLVVEYDSGSAPAANRYIDIRSTLPNNQTIPESGANDVNASTLAYNGTPLTWHDRNQQPLYILGFNDGTYEGNPYDARASRAIHGAIFEGETFTLQDAKTASGVGLYVASARDPLTQPAADNLYVTLLDLTTGLPVVNGETFAQPTDLTTSFDWKDYNFSGGAQTLPAGHQFRLYFSSPGSNPSRNYLILNESNPNTAEYNGLNWAGTDAQTTRSADSGLNFTDSIFIDLSYYLLVPGDHYADNGELTSSTLDTGNVLGAGFNRISWQTVGALPVGTIIKMQLAANNDNATWNFAGPAGTATDWYLLSTGENVWTGLYSAAAAQPARYLRYKIRLETIDNTVTPTVDWVRVNWSH